MKFTIKQLIWSGAGIFVISVLAIGLAIVLADHFPTRVFSPGYYAVFLDNGQVYFGKIKKENSRYLVLTNIFYLKSSKPVLSQEELQTDAGTALVKLGNELHGPEDWMDVNRAKILFVEKLKADSSVAKAIEQYQKK